MDNRPQNVFRLMQQTDVFDELVQEGATGVLLSPTDVSGFASAISSLAQDAAQRWKMGEAAYDWIQPYAIAATRDELYRVLRGVL